MPTVAAVTRLLEARYPLSLASDWDAVGLACGDPHGSVSRVLFAVDPVMSVVDEAMDLQVDLVVTHHPLFLRGVHSVAADTAKGRVAHSLISHGIALYCAHTNADHANPGVSDALADAIGLVDLRPLDVGPSGLDEPAAMTGTGRVGRFVEPVSLEQCAEVVAAVLPATAHGVRVAGDPMQVISRVAVCGGAGDSLLDAAARVADLYITADLRHHRALDHRAEGGCALIDVAHWASEWPWLEVAAQALRADLAAIGGNVQVLVSSHPTDPWTARLASLA